jgi:hypothetical protein
MNRHVIDVVSLHERASATPEAAPRIRPIAKGASAGAPVLSTEERALRATQLWFARAIMTPESAGDAVSEAEAAARLTAGPRLSALDRLEIYRRGYHARLIECLADDYPVLQGALGHEVFEALCRAYVAQHPSDSPSLNYYGRFMSGFLRNGAPADVPSRPFGSDLAALEWAIVEVIHAPSAEPLTLEGLGQVPQDAWPGARLVANTALQLQRFDYPVNAFFQQVREGAQPALPGPAPSATVVYRSGPTIWRMDLTEPMFVVLQGLLSGETLADALGRAEEALTGVDPVEAGQRVTHWFREWVSSGLFVGVEV